MIQQICIKLTMYRTDVTQNSMIHITYDKQTDVDYISRYATGVV